MGTIQNDENRTLADLNVREIAILVPIVVLVIWMGLHSSTFLRTMDTSIQKVVDQIEQVREPQIYRVEYRGH
jgi:NADH-quinone oxidoreductase subunit M